MNIKTKGLIIALCAVIVALVGVIAWQCLKPTTEPTGALKADPNAVDIREPDAQTGSTGSIAVPGFESTTVKAGQEQQNVWLYNPEKNNCNFSVTILLPDGTEVYKSGLIAPGKAIYTAEFTQQVKVGTYENAALQYDFYSLDGTACGGTKAYFTLEVER